MQSVVDTNLRAHNTAGCTQPTTIDKKSGARSHRKEEEMKSCRDSPHTLLTRAYTVRNEGTSHIDPLAQWCFHRAPTPTSAPPPDHQPVCRQECLTVYEVRGSPTRNHLILQVLDPAVN